MSEAAGDTQRYQAIRKVSIVGAVANLLLAIAKLIGGFFSQSQALIADGAHSFSDLATDLMVILAAKWGSKGADEEHPYGHARIETAFTVALAVFLVLVAAGIIWDTIHRLLQPELLLHPKPLALLLAAFSIFANEALYHYTLQVAKRVRSPLLRANAWHHRSDAISSVIVLVGVGGTLAGLNYLDAVASAGVALMIAKIGWNLGREATRELIDTGLDRERLAQVRESIAHVEGVKDLHMLRTRRMGSDVLVDVHVQVRPRLSVSEGHQIGEYVRARLTEEIAEVADVTVHVDPEDDDSTALSYNLPLRRELLARLYAIWRPSIDLKTIEQVNLHYLAGKIHVELVLPLDHFETLEQARASAQRLRQASQNIDDIAVVEVYFTGTH